MEEVKKDESQSPTAHHGNANNFNEPTSARHNDAEASKINSCALRNNRGNFKPHQIAIKDGAVELRKTSSTTNKDSLLRKDLDSIRCIFASQDEDEDGQETPSLCLLSADSPDIRLYFPSIISAKHWHKVVLAAQGFLKERMAQYSAPERKIADGPFATVTLCHHIHSKVKVAIKTISKAKVEESFGAYGEPYHELHITEELCRGQAPNMLQLFDSFEDDNSYYTVTRYYPEGDLLNYLARQDEMSQISEDSLKKIIWQLVEAVNGLHSRDILHRDIKIANVIVSNCADSLQVKLADFGSAVYLDAETRRSFLKIGTPGYIAPEMYQGDDGYGLPYDIWSLGALMFVLASGNIPFWSDNREKR